MANSITKWWEKQKMRYNYQVALGQRDKFIAESLKEIDRGNSEINSAKLSDLDKEERRLEFMRDITNGPTGMSIRFSKCQNKNRFQYIRFSLSVVTNKNIHSRR